jgi:hypothetical protein
VRQIALLEWLLCESSTYKATQRGHQPCPGCHVRRSAPDLAKSFGCIAANVSRTSEEDRPGIVRELTHSAGADTVIDCAGTAGVRHTQEASK